MTDESKLSKIRALLAQADEDSGATDAEREAFAQRAAELMAKYAVSEAMISAARAAASDPVEQRTIRVENPYPLQKVTLLNELAHRLSCKLIRTRDGAIVYGHRSDLERLELLYTSLLVQAIGMVSRARPEGIYAPTAGQVRSYRASWLVGFIVRIGERMDVGRKEAVEEAGTGAELVLRNRAADAGALMRQNHPRASTSKGAQARNVSGYGAGKVAGGRADLGQARVAGRRAIGA